MHVGISGLQVRINSSGYLQSLADNGSITEHRYIMEQKLGRKLSSEEIVHHIDGNKTNNDPSNLCLTSTSPHMSYHRKAEKGYKNCLHLLKGIKDESVNTHYKEIFTKNGKTLGRPKGS